MVWEMKSVLSDNFKKLIRNAIRSKQIENIEIRCKKLSLEEDDLKNMFLSLVNHLKSLVSLITLYLSLVKE